MTKSIYTIGVYGSTETSFFQTLVDAKIDLFVDIRQRRGMRGKKYAYANSTYLQNKLAELNIDYLHIKDLAPTSEIRQRQKDADARAGVAKQQRQALGDVFISTYKTDILEPFDMTSLMQSIDKYHNICFFCVEQAPEACHRSIVAIKSSELLEIPLVHLMPCETEF